MAEVTPMQETAATEYNILRKGSRVAKLPFSLDEYKYAYAMVNSRNFFVSNPIWINGGRPCLVPFADMLNHSGTCIQALKDW
jgi:hypothetical protein